MTTDDDFTQVKARVPTELYHRFLQIYPMWGATSLFLRSVMEELVSQAEADPRFAERIEQAVKSLSNT